MKASLEQLKESKKLELLLRQSRVALVGGLTVTTLAVLLCWKHGNSLYLLAWLAFYGSLSTFRFHIARKGFAATSSGEVLRGIRRRYTVMTFFCGLSWGMMSLYILSGSLDFGSILVVLAVCLTASGASVYAVYPSVFAAFAFPALLPPLLYLVSSDSQTEVTYGLLVVVFLALMSLGTVSLRRLLLQSIGIQFENTRLLDDIEKEKVQVSDLNKQLQSDLDELRKRDMQLNEEKERAEDLAEKLLILSTRDGLTGIANRRHFDEYLAKEWNRAVRSNLELSLILCDIDYFKSYNDYYGHQQGDQCLRKISSILEDFTRREGDLAARYGGEEFAIILPDTTLDNATILAEKIRTAIVSAAIAHEGSAANNIVTISMGLATIQPNRKVFSSLLIAEADKLLYRAKSEGRNRLVAGQCHVDKQDGEKNVRLAEVVTSA